jgi:hypothetical protein
MYSSKKRSQNDLKKYFFLHFLGKFYQKKKLVESRRWKKLGHPILICPRDKEKYGKCGFQIQFFFLWTFCTHRILFFKKPAVSLAVNCCFVDFYTHDFLKSTFVLPIVLLTPPSPIYPHLAPILATNLANKCSLLGSIIEVYFYSCSASYDSLLISK